MKLARLLLVGAVAVAVASCCNCRKASSAHKALAGEWQVVQMNGQSFKADDDSFTLVFGTDGKVHGKGDCNRLNGTFTNDTAKGTLSFGPMASTRMMCPNQANEDMFLRTLADIDAYSIDGRLLMLFSDGEQKIVMELQD